MTPWPVPLGKLATLVRSGTPPTICRETTEHPPIPRKEAMADHAVESLARVGPPRIGLYPGTFDPATNGHLDVIGRAARLLDKLVVGVAINTGKGPLLPLDERVELVRAEIDAIA